MIPVNVKLSFRDSGYIGQPFWPELGKVIDVNKMVHPKLVEQKKQQAIQAACEKMGFTVQDYERYKVLAARPFYTVDGTRESEIIIPQRIFQAFLNHTSTKAPRAKTRIEEKGLTFIGIHISKGYFTTGKTEADAKTFERMVKLENSNQRTLSISKYIIDFDAEGIVNVDPDIIKPNDLLKLTEWGGKYLGLGSARPQGYGRFMVTRWEWDKSLLKGGKKEVMDSAEDEDLDGDNVKNQVSEVVV